MDHALRIAMEWIVPEKDPAVLLLWGMEPDHIQHFSGLSAPLTRQGLREADAQFGRFLAWLEETGRAEYTNVIACSDHGHFTITS